MAVNRKQESIPNQLVSTLLLYRSRCRRACYLVAMGLLVLAAAACSANVELESSSPVTSAEIPGIMEAQPPAPPAASQVQPANIEPVKEKESGESIRTDIAKPMELPDTKASAEFVVPASEQPKKLDPSAASEVDATVSISVEEEAAEASTLPESPNENVGESVAASSETDNSSESSTSVLPRRFHVGGQARMLDAMQHRSAGVDEADITKTITIDIKRDEEYRYYFEPLEPLEVPAGKTVKFVVRNIHVDSSDCW